MTHTSIFNIQELLEYILHFLAVDKALYSALFVCWLWYRCGVPILWKRVELKEKGRKNYWQLNRPQLENFIKIVCKKQSKAKNSM